MGLVSPNSERRLIHSGKLDEVKLENASAKHQTKTNSNTKVPPSYVTHSCYALFFDDCFIIVKSTNVSTATPYDVDQVFKLHQTSTSINNSRHTDQNKQTQSSAIQLINVKDDVF